MSAFREELGAARREYRAIRYPADLSRQMLAPKMGWKGILLFGSVSAGSIAAAAVVAALMLRPLLVPASGDSRSRLPLVENMGLAKDLKFALPPLPGMPENFSFRPVAPDDRDSSDLHLPFLDDLHLPNLTPSSEHA